MLGRGAFGRLANEAAKQSTSDVSQLGRHLHRLSLYSHAANPVRTYRAGLLPLTRAYATTTTLPHRGRPKKGSVGEKAAKPRKRTAASKAPAKKAAKKAAPKRKKAAAPKKKAAPKRKVLTEAQKAKAADRKKALEIRELKKTALLGQEPKKKPYTAWTVFTSEHITKGTLPKDAGQLMKDNAATFKNLSASEKEHYNHLANQNKEDNAAAYKTWVGSHTAEQIRQAQAARRRLKQLVKPKKGSSSFAPIHDERQVKRPAGSFNQFLADRYASGDYKSIDFSESAKLIHNEFKALSQSEKSKYQSLSKQDSERYRREFKQVYGHDAPILNHSSAAATATAHA